MQRATERVGAGRIYTFRLNGDAEPPQYVLSDLTELGLGVPCNPNDVGAGLEVYASTNPFCHGTLVVNNGGAILNLGYSSAEVLTQAEAWVLQGAGFTKGCRDLMRI